MNSSAFLAVWGAVSFTWAPQASNTTESLRGLQAVSAQIAWASGTHGTYLRTTDGGLHWLVNIVPGAASLDFRDVKAFDSQTAYLLSSGGGAQSRIYKTTNGGEQWTLLFTNPDATGFLDALGFWDKQHGIALGDPVNGRFAIFTTGDGGQSWQREPGPAAAPDEGAFAASGTCLVVKGTNKAWFGTGGPRGARVFRSEDRGRSWHIAQTAIRNDSKSAGIFSLAFEDELHGEAVGGDYTRPADRMRTAAITSDAGLTWNSPPASPAGGYRSGVAFMPAMKDTLVAVGTSGSDVSRDRGQTWDSISSSQNLNAVSASPDGSVWAVGPHGTILKLVVKP